MPKPDGSSLTSIDWYPTHDSAALATSFGENAPLLITNGVFTSGYDVQEETLAVIGENEARHIAMGGNPMRNHRRDASSIDEQMHRVLENGLAWLTRRDDLDSAPFDAALAQLDQSYYFPDEPGVQEWLDERFPGQVTYDDQYACDGDALGQAHERGPGRVWLRLLGQSP